MARQTRLKQNPRISFLTVSGTHPMERTHAFPASTISGAVLFPPMTSTMLVPITGK